jgi:hypothetical protein
MQQLSRRRFLRLGLGFGALALLLGGPALARADEAALLDALSDRLFAEDAGTPDPMPAPSRLGAGARAWAFAANLPPAARYQLRGLLRGLEWGAVLVGGARFSRLDAAGQDRVLAHLAGSAGAPGRLALHALRQLCAMGTFTHPGTWAAIGYGGPQLPAAAP